MEDSSRVGEARRHAIRIATACGFDEVATGRVALVVTELGTNLIKHARKGRLLIASRSFDQRASEVEILSIDEGPGIVDLDQCMRDGFSSGGTPGTGLGAAKRLSDDFDMHSASPSGTLIVARLRARPTRDERAFRIGAVAIAAPGETVSGDGWMMAIDGSRANAFMVDGLGHGPMAEKAAHAALSHFQEKPFDHLVSLMESAHAVSRSTRGAAVAIASMDAQAATISSVGAGNVVMRVLSGVTDRFLLTQQGTLGLQIRKAEVISTPWPAHAVLAMHTDGIMQRWPRGVFDPLLQRDPSLAAALLVRDFCRGKDDATALVVQRT